MPKIYTKFEGFDLDKETRARSKVSKYIRKKVSYDKSPIGVDMKTAIDFNLVGQALAEVKQDLVAIMNQLINPESLIKKGLKTGSIISNVNKAYNLIKPMDFSNLLGDDLKVINDFMELFKEYNDSLDNTLSFYEREVNDPNFDLYNVGVPKQAAISIVNKYQPELFKLINLINNKLTNNRYKDDIYIEEKPKLTYFKDDDTLRDEDTDELYRGFGDPTYSLDDETKEDDDYDPNERNYEPSINSTISSKSAFAEGLRNIVLDDPQIELDQLVQDFRMFATEFYGEVPDDPITKKDLSVARDIRKRIVNDPEFDVEGFLDSYAQFDLALGEAQSESGSTFAEEKPKPKPRTRAPLPRPRALTVSSELTVPPKRFVGRYEVAGSGMVGGCDCDYRPQHNMYSIFKGSQVYQNTEY
jgi:hypothetical protein